MPQTVTKEVTTSDLRVNDVIVDSKCKAIIGHSVIAARMNRTRMVVSFAPDIEKPFSMDATFTVTRSELTEAEEADREYRMKVYSLDHRIERICDGKHVELIQKAAEYGINSYLRWGEIDDIMEGQERAGIQRFLREQKDYFMQNGVDELTALKAAFGRLIAINDDRYPQNPLSRSTATMSNIMDDLKQYVAEKVIMDITDYDMGRDELLDALHAANKTVKEFLESN